MLAQDLLTTVIVVACSVFALWRLMPAAGRRVAAIALLKIRWPRALARPLLRAAYTSSGGCGGCGGCSGTTRPPSR